MDKAEPRARRKEGLRDSYPKSEAEKSLEAVQLCLGPSGMILLSLFSEALPLAVG